MTLGSDNVALGTNAMISVTTGDRNVSIGSYSTQGATAAMYDNVFLGYKAGTQLGSSQANVIIGSVAGTSSQAGSNYNVLIGYDAQAPATTSTYALNIGNTLFGDLSGKRVNIGSKTLTLGAALEVTSQGTIASTLLVPRDTTANRPGTGVNGMLRYNTSTAKFEAFENGAWTNMITAAAGGTTSFPLIASPGTTPASAPSYSFTGSTTTGMLSQATGTLALATTGTARLSITNAGSVVVGKSSPFATFNAGATSLQVGGTQTGGVMTPVMAIGQTAAQTTMTNAYYLGIGANENATNSYRLIGFGYSNGGGTGYPAYIGYQETGGGGGSGDTMGDLIFGTRPNGNDVVGTERMRITGAGNVGIGVSTPAFPLDVETTFTGTGPFTTNFTQLNWTPSATSTAHSVQGSNA